MPVVPRLSEGNGCTNRNALMPQSEQYDKSIRNIRLGRNTTMTLGYFALAQELLGIHVAHNTALDTRRPHRWTGSMSVFAPLISLVRIFLPLQIDRSWSKSKICASYETAFSPSELSNDTTSKLSTRGNDPHLGRAAISKRIIGVALACIFACVLEFAHAAELLKSESQLAFMESPQPPVLSPPQPFVAPPEETHSDASRPSVVAPGQSSSVINPEQLPQRVQPDAGRQILLGPPIPLNSGTQPSSSENTTTPRVTPGSQSPRTTTNLRRSTKALPTESLSAPSVATAPSSWSHPDGNNSPANIPIEPGNGPQVRQDPSVEQRHPSSIVVSISTRRGRSEFQAQLQQIYSSSLKVLSSSPSNIAGQAIFEVGLFASQNQALAFCKQLIRQLGTCVAHSQ
jgi:hypothetical protein